MHAAYCGAISDTEIDLLPDDKTLNLPPAISIIWVFVKSCG
jgi:hypothetical protein